MQFSVYSAVQCSAVQFSAVKCTPLQCTVVHWSLWVILRPQRCRNALQIAQPYFWTALHCTALHCTAVHCTAVYCTAAIPPTLVHIGVCRLSAIDWLVIQLVDCTVYSTILVIYLINCTLYSTGNNTSDTTGILYSEQYKTIDTADGLL